MPNLSAAFSEAPLTVSAHGPWVPAFAGMTREKGVGGD